MIIESLDEYLETVAGYIYDNDKLVTYKWLSKELEVHVNVAKQILWEFSQQHRKERDLISTFLLMGTLPDGGMRVEVVKDADLSKAKEKYSKIISEHVYSLQKALPDIELLAISGDGDVKYSAIKCMECVERSEEEMHLLRWGTSMSRELQSDENTKSVKESARTEPPQEHAKSEQKATVSNKGATAQQKGFNNLFGKAANKQKSPTSGASNTEKAISPTKSSTGTKGTSPKDAASKKKQQKGGLDGFFDKNKSKTINTLPPEEEEQMKDDTVKQKKNDKLPTSINSNKQQKDSRGKKRNRSKEGSNIAKKRKRITIQSDSSDSESSNEQEEEPDLPPSPEKVSPVKARSPSPPRVKHEGGKRKVLKLVDKTFEEDGYLVTKKVHVYESCSEEEVEAEKQEVKKSEPPAETKVKKNTKQTTLMNFFKKS